MRSFKQNIMLVNKLENEGDLSQLKRGGQKGNALKQHALARPHLPPSTPMNASMSNLLSQDSWKDLEAKGTRADDDS